MIFIVLSEYFDTQITGNLKCNDIHNSVEIGNNFFLLFIFVIIILL